MKLKNIQPSTNHNSFESLPEEIQNWLKTYVETIRKFGTSSDGKLKVPTFSFSTSGKTVTVNFDVDVILDNFDYLDGDYPDGLKLGKCKNMIYSSCSFLEAPSFIPEECKAIYFQSTTDIESLKGISKKIKHCEHVSVNFSVKRGLAELMLIRGLKRVKHPAVTASYANSKKYVKNMMTAVQMLNACLENHEDIFEFQEQMIEADLGHLV
jgi:DNA-binding ferritin-like protein